MDTRRRICTWLLCSGVFLSLAGVLPAQRRDSRPPDLENRVEKKPEASRAVMRRTATNEEREIFAVAQNFFSAGKTEEALPAFSRFLKKYPASELADIAQYRIAEIYDSTGQSGKAFDAYQKLVTTYPDTREFEPAVARQLIIANKYLNTGGSKLFGISLGGSAERAQQMYEDILKNAPYSKHSPVAQFNLGLAFERQGKVDKARQAYLTVGDLYARSNVADSAMYQIGYLYMRLGLGKATADLTSLAIAREAFEDFLAQYPDSEKAPQARENIIKISDLESSDIIAIARFYDKSKNYHAAAIYYNDVIRRYPQGKIADEARRRIEALRGDLGDDSLRTKNARTDVAAEPVQRQHQARVETPALANYAGPAANDIIPVEDIPIPDLEPDEPGKKSRGDKTSTTFPALRTQTRSIAPMPFSEPALPVE